MPAFSFFIGAALSTDGIHRAGIYASAAVDAGVGINGTLVPCLADGVNRTGLVTCAAVNAFFANLVGQIVHLLLYQFLSTC